MCLTKATFFVIALSLPIFSYSENNITIDRFILKSPPKSTSKKPAEKITENKAQAITPAAKPPPGLSPDEIAEYNRKMHFKRQAEQKKWRDSILSVNKPVNTSEKTSNSGVRSNHLSIAALQERPPKDYAEIKTFFRWGLKESGYDYVDYEFYFNANDEGSSGRMASRIVELGKKGWITDLNRSLPETRTVNGKILYFVRHQMRFKKKK